MKYLIMKEIKVAVKLSQVVYKQGYILIKANDVKEAFTKVGNQLQNQDYSNITWNRTEINDCSINISIEKDD